jgi:hypothetical protein
VTFIICAKKFENGKLENDLLAKSDYLKLAIEKILDFYTYSSVFFLVVFLKKNMFYGALPQMNF